ncbi:bacteriohemerythrin [Defluviicoccus vanus]|uniref:Hemerythrin family protein n=1 Tax=Defluviicoccus vanus TaxID=111831 RepID=A0A7H1N4F5_9PROT|nr:bacteriohemerythrin [Defluviicoccus vanus]QNT70591.1 hemerythrin family protein [Defluviicoccus vanus]
MTPFRWRDNLSLDVPAVDKDHRHLIDLLNRLRYMALAGDDRQAVGDVLWELVQYTAEHFTREEMLMRLSGYPGYKAHRHIHDNLRQRVADLYTEYRRVPATFDVQEFYQFLADWLLMHILGEDMKIKPYVEKLAEARAA